jgi:formate hydrogenlyase subunit 3/multisubunit Na+/H+ antiporter MnhD subunit
VAVDGLSALFLLPLFVLAAACAVYGGAYLREHRGSRSLGPPWFFFNLLVASMALVLVARNAVLFLVAWEVMAVASFFLVAFDHERESVGEAAFTYLVASHLGTAFLLALFALLGLGTGSLDLDGPGTGLSPAAASLAFVLAVIGFGSKAGWFPFHVWLPEAHPAAPSHVSALMSGVLVKLGIYGLLRTLERLAPLEAPWWGYLLLAVGAVSAVYAILYALAETDLKRMLAYSTVENTGLIGMAIGLALVGRATGLAGVAWLGTAAALLHVVGHALAKGLLFLGAGTVLHATGTTEMERLGGLGRRMPWTAVAFLVGAAALAALPPTSGFVSELLLLLGAYGGLLAPGPLLAGLGVIATLALVAGLAALAGARAFGIVYLGLPRDPAVSAGGEAPLAMRLPMLALAAGTLALGLAAPAVLTLPLGQPAWVESAMRSLWLGLAGLAALLGLAALARSGLLARREIRAAPTWGCAYPRPTPRMQYGASSFAEPLLVLFGSVVRRQASLSNGSRVPALELETHDPVAGALYGAAYRGLSRGLGWFRWLQQGRVQLYVLYIALTLVALLVWARGGAS